MSMKVSTNLSTVKFGYEVFAPLLLLILGPEDTGRSYNSSYIAKGNEG